VECGGPSAFNYLLNERIELGILTLDILRTLSPNGNLVNLKPLDFVAKRQNLVSSHTALIEEGILKSLIPFLEREESQYITLHIISNFAKQSTISHQIFSFSFVV